MLSTFSTEDIAALLTLTFIEIVLGIDNIIFISILVGRLPRKVQNFARIIGLSLAAITRILLLLTLSLLMRLQAPLFWLFDIDFSGRDLVLISGGLFLLVKATLEIHTATEAINVSAKTSRKTLSSKHSNVKIASKNKSSKDSKLRAKFLLTSILIQIMLIDIVFSLDSVITAIGMASKIEVMIIAILISVVVMIFLSAYISKFIDHNPTIKMLALSFLVLIGVALIGDGISFHVPKGYIYFAMAFSVVVEMLNIRVRRLNG